ncbi:MULTISPECIES: formimidoylglutamase [Chryseobacterium]|uniref:Arginase family enzyme n=1 Tax=Chryseobacterium camelliae TaxID=1265445 RepID=A0ABU0TLH5_9FLAO|nr:MULTISPECIES: formimidoylglutamase [Chryseobacterium]MDT3408245.1 arginase family enzyme [Pseudacidovorax intermedius]MDQ1097900.1 arginase family enzyme [Chryseobacterium camelliae]MDQ1101834.1 arginase family enzyme [Chryseobacterium sp. SORGH_AS_1048]MDR6085272.1 arginase family enzyme [Chryseobacterium sp. SORGH_AS_0909]MDR6129631.1 arginase family enzyme [Chryseobacterium sp. SORGH_AS_1175]
MNFEDFILSPRKFKTESWQIGNRITGNIKEGSIVLLFVSDCRGAGADAEIQDFTSIRKEFYKLSQLDFEIPVVDLGDLVSGKSIQDSHYILQEVLSACHQKGAVPVVIGGSNDLSYSLFSALNIYRKNINYTQISNIISFRQDEGMDEYTFLGKIFSTKDFSIRNYHHLAYQKHLNEEDSVRLIREVEFDIVRLAEMMNSTEKTEPFFRRADLVTVNCDAIESFSEPFSLHPQVNGLNRREICAYMKEIGLSENLQSVGIFNYNIYSDSILNQQLVAQMLWYLIEGINIQRSHPKERQYEIFYVLINDRQYAFKRDTFSNLWYFGDDDDILNCIPCSRRDFDEAKKGWLNARLTKV